MSKITPIVGATGPLVVAAVYDGLCTFEFSIAAEIFGLSRPEMGDRWYHFASAAIERGPLRAHGGLRFETDGGPNLLDAADLIIIPGWKGADVEVPHTLVEQLRAAWRRGTRLASICSGAFVLAATGLLEGKRAATHWRYAKTLSKLHPEITVDANVLYVEEDRIFTSAGSAAGIDLMIHIVRQDFGVVAANSVARRLVMSPYRAGGQAQFIERPVPTEKSGLLAQLFDTIRDNPACPWSVDAMAREAAMSARTFQRRFAETTGLSPSEWLVNLRIDEAKRLLEMTKLPIEDVATKSGFGSVRTLRHHFLRMVGLSPREYRDNFTG
jgi:AraC family transcriptional regulator, transcriptional activator FtrA